MASGEIHVPLWVDYADDDKIIDAGEKAELLFVRGLCFMKRNKTDGFISDRQLQRILLPGIKARAKRLVDVELWERVTNGYYCPGFLKRNKSRAEIEETSEHRTAAALAANHRRWHSQTRSDSCPLCDPKPDPMSESSSQLKSESETKTSRKRRPPADFEPTEAHKAFAAERGLSLESERTRWVTWCEANGRTYASLNAGFSTWLGQAVDFGRGKTTNGGVDWESLS